MLHLYCTALRTGWNLPNVNQIPKKKNERKKRTHTHTLKLCITPPRANAWGSLFMSPKTFQIWDANATGAVSTQCLSLHHIAQGPWWNLLPQSSTGCQMTLNMNETLTLDVAKFCPCDSFVLGSLSRLAPYFHSFSSCTVRTPPPSPRTHPSWTCQHLLACTRAHTNNERARQGCRISTRINWYNTQSLFEDFGYDGKLRRRA